MTRRIDPTTWDRHQLYAHFRSLPHPWMAVTAEVDVTGVLARAREAGVGPYAALMHHLVGAANEVPALRQRIRVEGGADVVVEHDRVDPAFTAPLEGDRFGYATAPWVEDLGAFASGVAAATEALRARATLQPFEGQRDDVIYVTCLPWVRFTHVEHPLGPPTDSVPRLAWGRIGRDGDRARVPVNLLGHHALVDGLHVGRFFDLAGG